MSVYSISDVADDLIMNGSITKEDVSALRQFIGDNTDLDILIELLDLTNNLDWRNIHCDIVDLIADCIYKIFYQNPASDKDEEFLISLFDPSQPLNPFERKALVKIKRMGCGPVLSNFMDDQLIG